MRVSTERCGPIYQPFWSETRFTSPGPPDRKRLGIGRPRALTQRQEGGKDLVQPRQW